MKLSVAQNNLRTQYIDGAPGVLVSGLVWLSAGLVAHFVSFQASILAFFFGGMLIYPLSGFISNLIYKSDAKPEENPLTKLALEGTVFLFVGLFIAYILHQSHPELFYPIMLLIIGARYLTFQTLYGVKTYWALGVLLLIVGMLAVLVFAWPAAMVALVGGLIEVFMAGVLFTSRGAKPKI